MDNLPTTEGSAREHLNESYFGCVSGEEFQEACRRIVEHERGILRLMFAVDEREIDDRFRIYAVFSIPGRDRFYIPVLALRDRLSYPSVTPGVPAAHWYEREIRDLFGIVPEGHPDPRPLVFHGMIPEDLYPLRRDVSMDAAKKAVDITRPDPYRFLEMSGDGIYEIPVGPVHAGIIEPGHFRFSAVGETVFFLEPRLFYTHKGTEKQFEAMGFSGGVRLAERVSGTSSVSHAVAYCTAVERMAGIDVSARANAIRTILVELERLYNHVGDIGNMCAGTGFAVGNARGAHIREILMQLNERLTGSRYLRNVMEIGGVGKDIFDHRDDILNTLGTVTNSYKDFMKLILGTVSHVERLENTGRLARDIAARLGVTGVAGRASGLTDDVRKSHPHLLYDRLDFEAQSMSRGDVFARMMIRAEEAECSISMINALLEEHHSGVLAAELPGIPPHGSALGYAESPRGSVFYFVMSDRAGMPLRVKIRSASFCNWPAVPFAVHGNIVPDFPLCNKSFNLSYSGCDM